MPRIALPLMLCASLAACACGPEPAPAPPETAEPAPETMPERTRVTDLAAFQAVIDTHPTPDQLRARYPGLLVVEPGTMTTRELRGDNSRYFVELDAQGRIVGGRFQ